MQTMTELAQTFGISITTMHKIIKELEIPVVYGSINHKRVFTTEDVLKIENYMETKQHEDADNHPLVTDKRFLDLNYWPDTVPDIIKAWGV